MSIFCYFGSEHRRRDQLIVTGMLNLTKYPIKQRETVAGAKSHSLLPFNVILHAYYLIKEILGFSKKTGLP